MKKWRIITECWTEWVMTWMLREDFFLERWTSSRWFSRRNQVTGWLPWWQPSLLSSYSYTTLPSSSMAALASACSSCVSLHAMVCILAYCMIPFSALDDQSICSQKKGGGDVLLRSDLAVVFVINGWVTLVKPFPFAWGEDMMFVHQILWIFLFMCALAGYSDIWMHRIDDLLEMRAVDGLQCCLVDGTSGRGANVKCDFCLCW